MQLGYRILLCWGCWCGWVAIAAGQFSTIYNVPPNFPPLPTSLSPGTQVNVYDTGFVSGIQISANSELNVYGGRLPYGIIALEDGVVNVFGGAIIDEGQAGITVSSGAALNVSGGRIGIHDRGGVRPATIRAFSGSNVVVSGGRIGFKTETSSSSSFRLQGADFRLDGALIAGLDTIGNVVPVNLALYSVLSGVYSDGTPFAFAINRGDQFANGTLTLERSAVAVGTPILTAPSDPLPLGVHAGQTLVVDEGGEVPMGFIAGWGSTVQMNGGTIGDRFEAVGANVHVSGGSIGSVFVAYSGTTVTMSGGELGSYFGALNGSTVHLFGTEFVLNGVDVTSSLQIGTPLLITKRNVSLDGVLADGSSFDFDLSTTTDADGMFQSGATVLISRVLPGDFNGDGLVDGADFTVWRDAEGASVAVGTSADGNFDGRVTDADYEVWKTNFGSAVVSGGSAAGAQVPEPETAVIAVLLLAAGATTRKALGIPRPE